MAEGEQVTLSKKGSRTITVENELYSWAISAKGKGSLVLIIGHRMEKGQKIEVHLQSDINDYWTEFPH
ncbi:hypothetical protein NQ117_04325 [Paenibacillus sp. SC116]|nr:hypothetical protein [Paenibacillus sp. SC116]